MNVATNRPPTTGAGMLYRAYRDDAEHTVAHKEKKTRERNRLDLVKSQQVNPLVGSALSILLGP